MVRRRVGFTVLLVSLLLASGFTTVMNLDSKSLSVRIVPVQDEDGDCFRLYSKHKDPPIHDIHVQLVDDSTTVTERTIANLENGSSMPLCAPNRVDRVNITNFTVTALPSESWVIITSYGKPAANGTVNESAPRGYLATQNGNGPHPPAPVLSTLFPGLLTSLAIFATAGVTLVRLLRTPN